MSVPKKKNRRQQAKRTQKPPKFPGVTPPEKLPEFTMEDQLILKELQENCFKNWHRPRRIKIRGWRDSLFYICSECLEKFLEKEEKDDLKKLIVSIGV